MIRDARNSPRRCTTVTLEAKRVRNVASSIAVSPPPTTTIALSLKKKPSQVAHAETPYPISSFSAGSPSRRADAPVAMMSASAVTTPCSPVVIGNGRAERSTPLTASKIVVTPNRSAWARIRVISSGPRIPSGKPG